MNGTQLQTKGMKMVREAVIDGLLPNLKDRYIQCFDCFRRATVWEHRDYRLPLDVHPVCQPCNNRRGPADGKFPEDRGDPLQAIIM